MTRYWCHHCRKPFLLDSRTGQFTCVNCGSELIEELNGVQGQDDPRLFRPETQEIPSDRPMIYTVYTTTYFQPVFNVDLDRRIEAILNFINGHTGIHSGVQPATQTQIDQLQTVPESEVGGKDCPICQEELKTEVRRMPCGHMYHRECLTRWLELHNSCPVCRSSISGQVSSHSPSCHI